LDARRTADQGKTCRFVQSALIRRTRALKRRGNRWPAKILFQCPFLGTDADGQYTCRIYEQRFAQCRLFPLHAADLLELAEKCSYTFSAEPERAVAAPAIEPFPE
jgi:Fe-S-cluster containining protein